MLLYFVFLVLLSCATGSIAGDDWRVPLDALYSSGGGRVQAALLLVLAALNTYMFAAEVSTRWDL